MMWNSICRECPILPNEDDFELWEVSGLKVSCFRFNVMCKSCLKSLHKLVLSDVLVLVFLTYFLYMKQRCVSCLYRPVPAILYAAHNPLGPSNLWT